MINKVVCENENDKENNPAGGSVRGIGIDIHWQNAPRLKDGKMEAANGAFVEDVIEAAKIRLEFFQGSMFKCRENALAITKLEEALHWLDHRRQDRRSRGVEGKNEK